MDTEFEPFEDYKETEIPQPLPIAPSPVLPSDDPYLIVGQAHTTATRDTESELEEAPSETEDFEPLATRITPLSSDHTPTSSDLTPVSPLTDEEFEASKPSDTRTTSTHYIDPLDSTTPSSPDYLLTQTSPTLTRVSYYHSTARMVVRTQLTLSPGICHHHHHLRTFPYGRGIREEEAAPEGQQQAVPVVDTAVNKPLNLGYRALRHYISIYVPPVRVPVQAPPLPEWSSGSLPVSPSSSVVPTLVASPVTTPAATIPVDEDEFLEVGVQLELHRSIRHDHTQRLDALPPALFEGYDRDFRELYTRSRENTTMQRELQELRDRVTTLEREGSRREQYAELPDIYSFNDIHSHFDDNPLSGSTTYSSNSLLEEFTDELGLITYPPDYDDNLQCDIESDLREIEFLLYQGEDSSLKDSINQTDLANLDDYFVDPTPEMFDDKHALNYSFPLRFDVYDDDFLKIEFDADNFYDDPFDSKGEKIKESKLLIDELDLPCDFLPYSEYDSFNSQDFSRDDALPSPNNEDKVFNPGILIQKKYVTIITRVAQEKKLVISKASLLFEDFDPPFYETLVFKDVPKSMRLLLFSSENEEKVFKPGIYTSEK
nr:hypothetical protein [Tanacetum cinerariifolium]